jgi:FixJ family two-component response regulator
MPGQGGQELLDFLGSHEKNLPVIVMTGNANDRSRRRALESGAADFLEKPVDADQLIKSLLTALDEPQLRTNGQ